MTKTFNDKKGRMGSQLDAVVLKFKPDWDEPQVHSFFLWAFGTGYQSMRLMDMGFHFNQLHEKVKCNQSAPIGEEIGRLIKLYEEYNATV